MEKGLLKIRSAEGSLRAVSTVALRSKSLVTADISDSTSSSPAYSPSWPLVDVAGWLLGLHFAASAVTL